MPSTQEPSHPLKSALEILKNRRSRDQDPGRAWREAPDVLSGDDYPELSLLEGRNRPKQHPADAAESAGARLRNLVEGGGFRAMEAEEVRQALAEMLREGLLECFIQAVDLVRASLESRTPESRRWALEGVRALASLEEPGLIPCGTLPLLLGCVGRALALEERPELRTAALDAMAAMFGVMAARGDMEEVQARLAWLEHAAGSRGADYKARILASRLLVLPSLELFFKEGHAVLESRVMPFLRVLGEPAACTLTEVLGEERNRQHRNRILELLKLMGSMSLPALEGGLVTGSWQLIRNALNLVGDLEEPHAFEYVVPCLEHPDPRVVRPAVRALWKTGGARAESYLLAVLPGAEAGIQTEILEGLGHVGTAASLPPIEAVALDGAEEVRIKALEILGSLKLPEAIPFLERQLRRHGRLFKTSQPLGIRLAAARALASLGVAEARRVLEEAVGDEPNGPGREALRKVVAGLGSPA